VDLQPLKSWLDQRIVEGLRVSTEVEVDPLVAELGLDEDSEDELWGVLFDGDPLIWLEIVFDASPATNTPAAALDILDLGGDCVFLISPGEMGCAPMTVFAALPRGDRPRAFQLAGEVIVRSRREQTLPAGGGLADRLHVAPDFPEEILRQAYTTAIEEGSIDLGELEGLLRRLGAWPQGVEARPGVDQARVLADAYVSATMRRWPARE
jgi:hypothetical protein